MPGANCSIFGCAKSRTTKGLALFVIPKKGDEWHRDWREKLVNIITKDREIDADLIGQIERKSLHICELHFTEDQIICRKFKYIFFCIPCLFNYRLREGIFISLILYQSC